MQTHTARRALALDRLLSGSLPRTGLSLAILLTGVAAAGLACSRDEIHRGHGVVEQVLQDDGQIVIAHDEIEGLMPAMTMNFAIYDAKLLGSLSAGDVIDFDLTVSRNQLYITDAKVVGRADTSKDWVLLGDVAVRAEPAPLFSLVDQDEVPRKLEDFRGQGVLLDFVFTRCEGPCPILTSTHVTAERLLSPALRERTHFLSISIDPLRDTPADLKQYALVRGANLAHWSFLTGTPEDVQEILSAYGIGTTRAEDGEIEHVVASFLIDGEGRIVKRYLGLDHEPAEVAADLEAIVAGG